jgi:hypothetical protein
MSRERILGEFVDAYAAGARPEVDDYLARVAAGERDALAGEIAAFLEHAPAPRHGDVVRARIATEALPRAITQLVDEPGLWPALLPALRRRARMRRDELTARLAAALGVPHAAAKVARYYHGMEAGTLDPAGVSRRVLVALADLLAVAPRELEAVQPPAPLMAMDMAVMFSRADAPPPVEAMAPMPPPPEPPDEVDRLFTGGR